MPTALSNIDTALEGVGHVLRDRTLIVPPYQRSYSWRNEEVATFWWDLRSAFDAKDPEYFLGTVVLTGGSGGRLTVVDGQQRLATTAMLFTAIRDEFFRRDDPERAAVVEADYIAARDLRSRELRPRVTLNSEDDSFFRGWVVAHPPNRTALADLPDDLPGSNRRLAEALMTLKTLLGEHVDAAGPAWEDTLFRWIDLLEDHARVITLQVSDEADAFLIFETLNDRGLDLSVADLLKNYLFMLSRDDISAVQRSWLSALDTIFGAADEETFTTFIRHYWSSLYGATRERELYARLKARLRTREASVAFSDSLDEVAPLYAGLVNSAHPVWERWAEIRPEVETLLRLGLEQNRPLLLAAMQRFEASELARLIRSLVNWSVRGLIVGGIGGGTTERYYAEAATEISASRITTTDEILRALSSIVPPDDEFQRQFEVTRVNKTRLARYYLIALHQFERAQASPASVSFSDEEAWNLQLALPRRADFNEWPEFPMQDLGQWANRIGNQFVVPRGVAIPDTSTAERAAELAAMAAPCPSGGGAWTPQTIMDRQFALAEMAVQVWPRSA